MTIDLDDLPFDPPADDSWPPAVVVEREPRKHKRHDWQRAWLKNEPNSTAWGWGHARVTREMQWPDDIPVMACFGHAEPYLRDEAKARRGKSSRRLGHDGERRSEKRYGWRKVGEFGGITDLEGTLAIVQQKTSRRTPPTAWMSIFRALEGRAGGKVPLLLLSFVKQGVDTEDFIVIRGRDWLQLHGKDEPQ